MQKGNIKRNQLETENRIVALGETETEAETQHRKERMWHNETIQTRNIAYRKLGSKKNVNAYETFQIACFSRLTLRYLCLELPVQFVVYFFK